MASRVEFDGRGLILRGRADSYHAKQLAQHVAMAALGLPLSANEIVVTYFRRGHPDRGDGIRSGRSRSAALLLASGDDRLRSECSGHLAAHGYVVTAAGGVECVELLREFTPDAVVLDTDLHWGGATASSPISVRRQPAGTRRVAHPLGPRPSRGPDAGQGPVVAVIEKPIEMDTLVWAVLIRGGGRAAADPGPRTTGSG